MKKKAVFLFLAFVFFAALSVSGLGQVKEAKEIKIFFPNGSLNCEPTRGTVTFQAISSLPEAFSLGGGDEWEVSFLSAGLYYIRHKNWGGNPWKVDVMKRRIIKISEGAGLTAQPDMPLGFEVVVLRPGEPAFGINFKKLELRFDVKKMKFKLLGDSYLLSNCQDLTFSKIHPQLYHLRNRLDTGDSFWKVNLETKQLIYTTEGTFGEVSEKEKDSVWPDLQIEVKY